MKIAVITMHAVKNYGSVLQTYATQKTLEKFGMDVKIINYIRERNLNSNLLNTWTSNDRGLKKIIKKIILAPTISRWKKIFGGYLRDNIRLTNQVYKSELQLFENPIDADIFCTGSDQVWNSGWNNGVDKTFYLSFVRDNTPKIALAASFGKNELDQTEVDLISPYIESYKYISLRETSGIDIVKKMGFNNISFCLDPTLLLSKEEWMNHSKPYLIKKKYILIYQLNHDTKFDEFATEFAKRKKMQLVRICTRYDQIRLPGKSIILPQVQELLSLFNGAEFILTNSFHATAFSINLNKEFIAIYPDKYSSRIIDILKIFGLENRHLTSYDNYNIADNKIDYSSVNNILYKTRDESMNLISKMISMCGKE